MNTIYTQHEKAFAKVQAFIIMQGASKVATVAFKFPSNGAGRLSCYLHVSGLLMVKGNAGGYGYDKKSAAFYDAAAKQAKVKLEVWQSVDGYEAEYKTAANILAAVAGNDGRSWDRNLQVAGFTVLQAV